MDRRKFMKSLGLGGAGLLATAIGLSAVAPAEAGVSVHSQAKVFGGAFQGYYQGVCPCGWKGNRFTWWKSGAKSGAQSEVNWHKNSYGG